MKDKPNAGQKVRFNNDGLHQVFGSCRGLSHMKNKVFTITKVEDESWTPPPEETFTVEVDDPGLSTFIMDNHCFDLVESQLVEPCPFCGGKSVHSLGDRNVRMPDMVQCLGCGAGIQEEYEPYSALTKWNRRVMG